MARQRRMSEAELTRHVEFMIHRSDFFDNTEIENNRKQALDAYFGRDRPPHVNGRSNAMSMDTTDAVESITSNIFPAFDFDEVAMFDAAGAEDVNQARLESNIVNRFLKLNNGRIALMSAIKDALLLRNGIIQAFVDERKSVDQERYTGLSELELQIIQQPNAENQSIRITRLVEHADDHSLTDVSLTRTTTWKQLKIEAIDPANFIVPREFNSPYLDDAEIVGVRRFIPRGTLRAMGFSKEKVDALRATSNDWKVSSLARNRDFTSPNLDRGGEKSLDRIEVYELYIRVDVDRDGVNELRKIIYAGQATAGQILSNEIWPFQPFASGTGYLLPHRFWGLSVFDRLVEISSQKSRALRQYEDNLNNSNFNELVVVDGDVNMPDAQARRPGGIIRADAPGAVAPVPIQDTGTSSRAFLAYLDEVRSDRVGASLDMQGAQFQIAGESAHGIERQMSTKEQLAQLMGRTLGETLVVALFRIIHRTLREFMPNSDEFPVGPNRFVTATPGDWPARQEVTVLAGMSNAERVQKRNTFAEMLLQQEKLFSNGMNDVLMNLDTYHSALLDWSKSGGISSPRRYWLDPNEPAQQQALQQQQQEQAQQAKEQQQLQERLFTTQVLMADRDNQTDLLKQIRQLRFDYWSDTLKSESVEFKSEAQGAQGALDTDQATGRKRAIAPDS